MTDLEEISNLSDIPVQLEVELDHKVLTLRAILALKKGSLIRLTRSAGENIDILLGTTLLGFGEIVVIEDRMGVRITDLASEET